MLSVFVSICVALYPSNILINVAQGTDQVSMENLISNYLSVEEDLWRLLGNGDSTALQQVHDLHEPFFNKSITETIPSMFQNNVVDYDFLADDSARKLNITVKLCHRHFESSRFFNKNMAIAFASTLIDKVEEPDGFFNITTQSDFWTTKINRLRECHNETIVVTSQSTYQVLLDFYEEIQATLLKHYMGMQVSYMILYFHQVDAINQRQNSIQLRKQFLNRISNIQSIARPYLESASREVWLCDPSIFLTDYDDKFVGCEQITNFLQSYVTYEANLDTTGSCTETCEYYQKTRYFFNYPTDLHKCNGILRNCMTTFDKASVSEFSSGDRKIFHIKDDDRSDESSMGNTSVHYRNQGSERVTKLDSWTRWFVKCSNCICTCDDPINENSDRFFSLREAVSNIYDNKIVTGVSFSKQNHMIRLIIAEGYLKPFYKTNVTVASERWMRFDDEEIWKVKQNEFKMSDHGVQEGVDYHTLTFEHRGINLDTVMVPRGQLVTGVRLHLVNGRLRLEVRGTQFDCETGLLKNMEDSTWTWNSNGGENQIVLHNPANPTISINKSVRNKIENAFIEFGPSGNWADAGQTTVPFIDTQRVEPYAAVGLSGVGIYYKGQIGYGGFIGPMLVVYDTTLSNGFSKKDKIEE